MRFGGSAVDAGVFSTACSAVFPSVADGGPIWIEVLSAACSAVVPFVADGDAISIETVVAVFVLYVHLAVVVPASCVDRGRRCRFVVCVLLAAV